MLDAARLKAQQDLDEGLQALGRLRMLYQDCQKLVSLYPIYREEGRVSEVVDSKGESEGENTN